MFNTKCLSYNTIMDMGKEPKQKQVSDQMTRLYQAARDLKGWSGQSFIARELGVSPQTLNNWEGGRSISQEGLIAAQEKIGCDAIWLRDGTGDMVRGGNNTKDLSDVAELVALYNQLDTDARRVALNFMRGSYEAASDEAVTHNKL